MAHRVRPEDERPAGYQKYMVYAEDLKKLRVVKQFLCTEAIQAATGRNRPTDDQIADTCRSCKGCAYGERFAQLWDEQKEAERMATVKKAADEATLQEQYEQKLKECQSLTVRLEAQEEKTKELVEALTIKAQENEELSEHITQMSKGIQELGRKIEIAEAREKESSHEMKVMTLQIIRLKAEIYDLEHEDED